MKKLFTLFFFLFALLSSTYAQKDAAHAIFQRKDVLRLEKNTPVILPQGFTYANRANAKNGQNFNFGILKPSMYLVANEIKVNAGCKIKGLSYYISRAADNTSDGKVFVASRNANGTIIGGSYRIVAVESVTQNDGLNSFSFKEPIVTKADEYYIVGYETYASGASGYKTVNFTLGNETKEGSLIKYSSSESFLGEVGTDVTQFYVFNSYFFGNSSMVIDLEDPTGEAYIHPILDTDRRSYNAIVNKEHSFNIRMVNNGSVVLNNPTISLYDASGKNVLTQYESFECQPGEAKEIEVFITPKTKKNNSYLLHISQINGKEYKSHDLPIIINATNEGETIFKKNLLIERQTSETCFNCPDGDKRMEEAKKMMPADVNIIEVYQHYADFTSIKEADTICEKISEDGMIYAPGFTINRFGNEEMARMNRIGGTSKRIYFYAGEADEIATMYKEALTNPTESVITKISRIGNGIDTKLVVEGKTLASDPNEILLSVWRTQDGILASNGGKGQANGGENFVHDYVLRKVYTGALGMPVVLSENKTFKIEIPITDYSEDWDAEENHFVVFIHRSLDNDNILDRYIYDVQKLAINFTSGVREVSPENRPVAFVENGKIILKGMYDSYKVFDIMGREMNRNEVLSAGVYVVKALKGTVDYVSKVVVR